MTRSWLRFLSAALLLAGTSWPCFALDLGGVTLGDEARVAGRKLTLNGAGIGMRAMVFRVYVIGLYLPSRKRTAAEVVQESGPRRLMISMLRNVSATDFRDSLTAALADARDAGDMHQRQDVMAQMSRVSDAMSRSGRGLERGDQLTLDWLPDKGTVIAINQQPVMAPLPGADFYNALLDEWIGDKPTDAALKPKLLGSDDTQTASAAR